MYFIWNVCKHSYWIKSLFICIFDILHVQFIGSFNRPSSRVEKYSVFNLVTISNYTNLTKKLRFILKWIEIYEQKTATIEH